MPPPNSTQYERSDANAERTYPPAFHLVDVGGFLLVVSVTAASVQDRDGAAPLIHAAHGRHPTVTGILVGGAYTGEATAEAMARTKFNVEISKLSKQVRGFSPERVRLLGQ